MSDDTNKVQADLRENFGKGFARRLRAAGKIPAVIYGHGTAPKHVALPGHQVGLLVRRANIVLDLDVAGTKELVLVKDVQRDPVLQIIEHIDLIVIKKGERVHVEVPVHLVGESAPGTLVNLDAVSIRLEVEATHIPESVTIDITGREEGEHILASDVVLPKGSTLVDEPDLLIVGIGAAGGGASAADDAAEEAAVEEATA